MSASRFVALPLALFVAACGTRRVDGPRPLIPDRGPPASIRVGYEGGMLNRSMHAFFRVERNAYVLVGHLGGDGIIRVLYPTTPEYAGWVPARRNLRTQTVHAPHDALPSLFAYSISRFRSVGARHDSYDGRGHGFVFLIASSRPLAYGTLEDDSGHWSEWRVSDYDRTADPRYAVRDFADAIAGSGYTLKYAGSISATQYDYASSQYWDCALLNSLGLVGYRYMWTSMSSWYYAPTWYANSPADRCGHRYEELRYAISGGWGPTGPPTVIVPPAVPTPAPKLDRPGRRGLGSTPTNTGRSTITRVAPGTSTGEVGPARSRPTYGTNRGGRSEYEPSRRAPDRDASTPRAWGHTPNSETRGSGNGSSSSGSTRETGSTGSSGTSTTTSSGSTPSRSTEGRSAASPREARPERPEH